MHTSINDEDHQPLARAWALLDGAEYLARQAAQTEPDSSLWLLAANSILRARDALEAIYPDAAHGGGHESLPDGTGQDLVQAAARHLRNIPQDQETEALSLVLGYLAEAEHEVAGRFHR
jgi:hypothetical protein